jgi:hypothetical protein
MERRVVGDGGVDGRMLVLHGMRRKARERMAILQ